MDGESDEDNEPMFDDDDGLTWATVVRASRIEESSYATRAITRDKLRVPENQITELPENQGETIHITSQDKPETHQRAS
ncbi:hypothetical protein ACSBR2_041541 [Camellia fascicularis]